MAIANVFPGAHVYEHGNWGYPYRGNRRRIRPTILGVSHITGNSSLPSALAEMQYSARAGSGASFPFCVNRNGTVVQGYDPISCAPWTNGDLRSPDTANPLIRAMVGSPYNANEFCLVTIENVGYEPGHPLTDAQVEANARIYAWAARLTGATRIELDVVIGHRQINSVSRRGCPTAGDLLALRRRIVAQANALLNPDEDEMDARPGTFHARTGHLSLRPGVTYNGFRYLGRDDAGKPILKRYNGIRYGGDGSGAAAIGLAHWDAGMQPEDCYLVSPYIYLAGDVSGSVPLLWWSRSPLPPPTVTWTDGSAAVAAANGRTEALRQDALEHLTEIHNNVSSALARAIEAATNDLKAP